MKKQAILFRILRDENINWRIYKIKINKIKLNYEAFSLTMFPCRVNTFRDFINEGIMAILTMTYTFLSLISWNPKILIITSGRYYETMLHS